MTLDAPMDLRQAHSGIGGRLLFWEYIDRLHRSMKWNVPSTVDLRNSVPNGAIMICGAGPSIADDLPFIREMKAQGGKILTCNKTYEWLAEQGIIADYHCMLDPMPWVADYVKQPRPGTKFLIAHQCDPSVIRRLRLKGGQCYLWISASDYYGVTFPPEILMTDYKTRAWSMIAGATTVGLRAVFVAYDLGFRSFHMFGMDSSMVKGEDGQQKLHVMAKDKPQDAQEGTITLNTKAGKWQFYTNNHMSKQVTDFEDLLMQVAERIKNKQMEPIGIRVYGDGLLPAYAASVGLHADESMNRYYQGIDAA